MNSDSERSERPFQTANEKAQPWGYVNDQGQVWLKDSKMMKGKIVGQVFPGREEEVFAKLAARFQELWKYHDELAEEASHIEDKPLFLSKIYQLLEFIPDADALGDFDGLILKLHELKKDIDQELDDNYRSRLDICRQIAALARTGNWKEASEEVKQLQERFKASGPVPEVRSDEVWKQFHAATDSFYEARKQAYEEQDRVRERNLVIKDELCAKAEGLSLSDNWKEAAQALKLLQSQWKETGPVPREKADALWDRFKKANDIFFARREEYFGRKAQERSENLRKKEELCEEVEKLAGLKGFRGARERVVELQQQWKAIGEVPKEKSDEVWMRFKTACDNYFQK